MKFVEIIASGDKSRRNEIKRSRFKCWVYSTATEHQFVPNHSGITLAPEKMFIHSIGTQSLPWYPAVLVGCFCTHCHCKLSRLKMKKQCVLEYSAILCFSMSIYCISLILSEPVLVGQNCHSNFRKSLLKLVVNQEECFGVTFCTVIERYIERTLHIVFRPVKIKQDISLRQTRSDIHLQKHRDCMLLIHGLKLARCKCSILIIL